jgi:cbb3-type cytochrome c oxidase subunit III
MVLRRIVSAVQLVSAGFALATVILLFTRQPPSASSGSTTSPGEALFAERCASCHGPGAVGASAPRLAGVVAAKYPNIEIQIAIVASGKGSMPAFGTDLTPAEIRSVVNYTRSVGTDGSAGSGDSAGQPVDAAEVYRVTCSGCHDDDGRGSYANGVSFVDGAMVRAYPDANEQIKVVAKGKGGMEGFEGKLTPEEIAAVVEYTRTHF